MIRAVVWSILFPCVVSCVHATYPASDLLRMAESTVKAHAKLRGKRIIVTGSVRRTDMTDGGTSTKTTTRVQFNQLVSDSYEVRGPPEPYAVIDAGDEGPAVYCFFPPGRAESVGELEPGDTATVQCHVLHVKGGDVVMHRCKLLTATGYRAQ